MGAVCVETAELAVVECDVLEEGRSAPRIGGGTRLKSPSRSFTLVGASRSRGRPESASLFVSPSVRWIPSHVL